MGMAFVMKHIVKETNLIRIVMPYKLLILL